MKQDNLGSHKVGDDPQRRDSRPRSKPTMPTGPDDAAFQLVYDTIRGRRAGYDLLMWQTPALGMTAQAFLMSVALGPDTKEAARTVASLLACVVALLSMQLMAKHRYHEGLDARLLVRLENGHGLSDVLGIAPHAPPRQREQLVEALDGGDSSISRQVRGATGNGGWLVRQWRRSSYQVWMAGLALFAIVDVALAVLALVDGAALSR